MKFDRLEILRDWMKANKLDAFIIPSADPHFNEYLSDHWNCIHWISGFSGSSATLVITSSVAELWTDSRYFLQAEKEIKAFGFQLHKLKIPHTPEYIDWMIKKLPTGSRIGFGASQISIVNARTLEAGFGEKQMELVLCSDPFAILWPNRPPLPFKEIFELEERYAGQTRAEKLKEIRAFLYSGAADYLLVTMLDEIAWLLNLRGKDIDFNPVFHAWLLVGRSTAILFAGEQSIPPALNEKLLREGIEIHSYSSFQTESARILGGETLIIDPAKTSYEILHSLPGSTITLELENPIEYNKAIKNETEVENLRKALRKDAVVLANLYYWMENNPQPVSEWDIVVKLDDLHSRNDNYQGPSFGTIASFGPNGAQNHYSPKQDDCLLVDSGILLLDSGAQYFDGTTDMTRTTVFGASNAKQRQNYTLVLKGLIQLSTAIFPAGTSGNQIDVLARKALWDTGQNYGHGTGHGVGYFLNVHEGPQTFGRGARAKAGMPLAPGMILTIEPGLYFEGKYGIRIENMVLVKSHTTTEFGEFLHFETLTTFPIDTDLIDPGLLLPSELEWLSAYNEECFNALIPYLDPQIWQWLNKKYQFTNEG